jgi:lysophospholipase L1-like esterase
MNVPNLSALNRTRPSALAVLLAAIVMLTGCQTILIPDPAVRYIAFGDSTTAGRADRQYWEFVRDDLGLPADSFAGQGHGGETTAEGLARLNMLLNSDIYPNAEVLLYWEGGKDVLTFVQDHDPLLLFAPDASGYPFKDELSAALDTVEANIQQAVQMGLQAGLAVYVATYFSFSPDADECKPALLGVLLPGQIHQINDYVELLNDRIRQAAARAGAVLVDAATLTDQLAADPANYVDCIHLSDKGNQMVARVFEAVLP